MPTLLVLLKYPEPGQVKTRLAASLGAERTATLYRQWIDLVFTQVQPLRGSIRVIALYDGAPLAGFAIWKPLADEWWPQPEGDLGARLAIGFEQSHFAGQPVVAIGTDCLDLDSTLIQAAFAQLTKYDVVFGPTPDGGYYLVGTSRHLPDFFQSVPWSNRETLWSHIALCERHGWTVSILPSRRDIDTIDDWHWHCLKDFTT